MFINPNINKLLKISENANTLKLIKLKKKTIFLGKNIKMSQKKLTNEAS